MGNSLILLGDSATMFIDVAGYCTNYYAEHVRGLSRPKTTTDWLTIDVYVPAISLLALCCITIWIFIEALGTLTAKSSADDKDTDVVYVFIFGGVNMLVDVASFYGFLSKSNHSDDQQDNEAIVSNDITADNIHPLLEEVDKMLSEGRRCTADTSTAVNVNMLTALAHVSGDFVRTVAALTSATVATATGYSSSVCDAWAAMVAIATIVIMVGSVTTEIVSSYKRIMEEHEQSMV